MGDKVKEYSAKASSLAIEAGSSKAGAAAIGVLIDMALKKDDVFEALALGKKLVGFCHEAGDGKGEADALCRLAELYLGAGMHEKSGKVAEMALAILYGINDQEGMAKARKL